MYIQLSHFIAVASTHVDHVTCIMYHIHSNTGHLPFQNGTITTSFFQTACAKNVVIEDFCLKMFVFQLSRWQRFQNSRKLAKFLYCNIFVICIKKTNFDMLGRVVAVLNAQKFWQDPIENLTTRIKHFIILTIRIIITIHTPL